MASDYKKISEEHEKRYGWDEKPRRIYKRLYSDKTHFIYELIQNADDSRSANLELRLNENRLLVWNDGRQFNEKDVRSICSLGLSDKDLTHIGTFGIGFKAVYNYTDFPEIYSGDERFRIQDFVKPEGIDERIPEIEALINAGKTVFCLPFKGRRHQVDDIGHLKDRLCNLSKERSLLFLRNLKRVEWRSEHKAQTGSYACHRQPYDKIQDVPENESVELVNLTAVLDGNNTSSETFLVFCREVHPPKVVIDKLLKQAEDEGDEEAKQRLQQSAEEPQPIEIAFKLQNHRITAMNDNCVLFAYLPTQQETHLKFLVQARYQTTPARSHIANPSENPWNRWLVRETAAYLPEVLEQLKAGELLAPAFFNVLPLKKEVKNDFRPIADASREAMKTLPLVPTQDGGYAKAENVFYPESTPLRKLVKSSGMHSDSSLLHPYIRKNVKKSERCFDIMAKAGVKEIKASDLLRWLEKQSLDWFKKRTNQWLRSLYIYFNRKWGDSQWRRIKKIPLVRLENGEHVCVSDQSVYLPPDTEEERQEIESFLGELRILRSALLKGKKYKDIEDFLESLGVEVLYSENLISESICPLYSQPNKPSVMQNRRHVRYIFKSWEKGTQFERSGLEECISGVPILRAYKGIEKKIPDFVVPCNAYLPQAYTGDDDLETYFSVYDGELWFVDDKYLTNRSDTKAWLQFLKAIGAMDTPSVIQKNIVRKSEDCQEFGTELAKRNLEFEYTTQGMKTSIKDLYLHGLPQVLDKISKSNDANLSRSLWQLLVKIVNPLPSDPSWQVPFFNDHFQGIYRWFYRTNQEKYFDATFYRQLKETAWLPDEQGNLHSPDECFVPTSENQKILGDSVTYLHSDFDISTQRARWLAEKLGMHLQADAEGVFDYLQILSQTETSIEKIKPIYEFLRSEDEHLWRFEEESLIFTPEPEPHWWRTDEVFWEDESAVFGDDRGYLKAHYSEDLKSFFITSLEVPERADAVDYVRGIQDIASKRQAGTEEIRDHVQELYRRLWLSVEKDGDSLEDEEYQEEPTQICEYAYWLGKKGDEWGFFSSQELVWKDDDHRSELFKNEIPFWAFNNDLLELAKELGIKGCYQDSDVKFSYRGSQEEDTNWSTRVRNLRQNVRDFLNSPRLHREHGEKNHLKF